MGLRLSPEKTLVTHIDEGLDFLGWRIQRHRKRGTGRHYVYTYPSRKAVKAVHGQGEDDLPAERNQPLETLLRQLNPALQGWCAYFRPGVSAATFAYLAHYTWAVVRWHGASTAGPPGRNIRRRYCDGGWWPATGKALFNPAKVATTRYRYRGAAIPAPWPASE